MILLDTHALVWMDEDAPALGPKARDVVQQAWDAQQLAVSAISFWECAMLQFRGRLKFTRSPAAWRAELLSAGLIEVPLDGEIAMVAAGIESLHKDPADRFIAATAIVKGAALVTADTKLLKWKHRLQRHDAAR